jgi:hypothetical protein
MALGFPVNIKVNFLKVFKPLKPLKMFTEEDKQVAK